MSAYLPAMRRKILRALVWGIITPLSAAIAGVFLYLVGEAAAYILDSTFNTITAGLILCALVGASIAWDWNDGDE